MIEIGTLSVDFDQREIRQNGQPVRLGARAFAILEELYRARGAVISKDEIMDAVWPGVIVEENRLQVHMAALRKLLGADRDLIKTVPGRGYVLVRPTEGIPARGTDSLAVAGKAAPARGEFPIGREGEVARIIEQVGSTAVITVVGAGGIGKTCLARCVASEMESRYGRHVCFVELWKASSRDTVLATLAEALGVIMGPDDTYDDAIATAIAASNCLVILDNAEHVIDVVASLVDALVARNPMARFVVTSREPLHIWGETVLRLEPLAVPASGEMTDAILSYSAVVLFLRRAFTLAPECAHDEASIALVAEICRRLGGLPLAIELAAARVATLGLEGVASRLDDRLNLLTGGLRSGLPRHQTLRATFDWSYMMLDSASQALFRRTGCFFSTFSFEAVCAVAAEPDMSVAVIISSLSELATKSLLNVEFRGAIAFYRLTESTRAYALEKLRDEGESQIIAARHVRYMRSYIEGSGPFVAGDDEEPGASPRFSLDDARSAYDWAFSAEGDPALGVALAGALVGRLLGASHVRECCERARRALTVLDGLPPGAVDAECEMKLCAAYAASLIHTGEDVARAPLLWERVLRLARSTGNDEFAIDALWGLWNTMLTTGDIHTSMRYALRYQHAVSGGDSRWRQSLAEQMIAISLHYLGEQEQAGQRLEQAIEAIAGLSLPISAGTWLTIDPLIWATGTAARIALLQCKPERAMRLVERSLDRIRGDMLEPSLNHVLALIAVPVALESGEQQAASNYLALLRSQAASHRLDNWRDYAEYLAVKADVMAGREDNVLERLEPVLQRLVSRGFQRVVMPIYVLYAEALGRVGRIEEARVRLDEALAFAKANGNRFNVPELSRVRGWLELQCAALGETPAAEIAQRQQKGERLLRAAIEQANSDGAPLWAMRAEYQLAEHLLDRGEVAAARNLLNERIKQIDVASKAPDFQRLVSLAERLQGYAA
ncbi:putative ATPase/DNA-binding winged helix-turn-helix (wHTH) protein [Paraburkholderia atlantica]|uniref:ATP-binding protein n=1 Tax=Paraburkholderia atlantica TaxID=2654982 RepID=UPI003D2626FA